jgi:predicted nucleotide-binding protein
MDPETAKRLVAEHGLTVVSENDLNNGIGVQLRTAEGPILSVYKTGKCVPGGKRAELLKPVLARDDGRAAIVAGKSVPDASRKVFVVYGHDNDARGQLEAMLRRWGLEPLILDQLPSGGQTIIEKLESVRGHANYAVVLATADDEGIGKPDRTRGYIVRGKTLS